MYTRTSPYIARIKERVCLSKARETYHIVLAVEESALKYKPGDSVGIFPANDPELVNAIVKKHGAESFREKLTYKANLHRVPHEGKNVPLLAIEKPNFEKLLPLMPRFYSIASSERVFPGEIHLTVIMTRYLVDGRMQRGVGSAFLCEEAVVGETPVPLYVQPSNHFQLPSEEKPIILIGPGTGVAPYRAFLQERMATQSTGTNWLFFGERNIATDFYYEEFWRSLEKQGRLRLDTAFSRDQPEKIYVQHRLLEHKNSVRDWIQSGASIYVCGDAEKMAKDVDFAFRQIISEEELKQMRKEKRYLLDVY